MKFSRSLRVFLSPGWQFPITGADLLDVFNQLSPPTFSNGELDAHYFFIEKSFTTYEMKDRSLNIQSPLS
jgi:hypothetical protein